MRDALTGALQSYAGALVTVSHDRHVLSAVSDELWLVDGGHLHSFEGDLDDYPAWLARRKSAPVERQVSLTQPLDRRELRAQQNRLRKIENEMARLTAANDNLLQELAQQSLYDDSKQERLLNSQARQAETSARLAQIEEEWLQLSEAIEKQGG